MTQHNTTTQRFARTTKQPTYSNQYDTKVLAKINKEIAKDIAWTVVGICIYIPLLVIVMSL